MPAPRKLRLDLAALDLAVETFALAETPVLWMARPTTTANTREPGCTMPEICPIDTTQC